MLIALVVSLGVIFWVACSLYTYSTALGYFQHKYWDVRDNDYGTAIFVGILGPIGALMAYVLSERGKWGRAWTCSVSEWKEAQHKRDKDEIREAPWEQE